VDEFGHLSHTAKPPYLLPLVVHYPRMVEITNLYWVPPPCFQPGDAILNRIYDGDYKEMISQLKEEINITPSTLTQMINKSSS
jgi:hypothetical protein